MITGSTEVPGVGTVHWTAKQITAWGGDVVRTIPLQSDGPDGPLDSDQLKLLQHAEPRLR